MRVLCVEDEADLREDIAEFLRMQSHEVDEAANGQEAIERLKRAHYDLVLCDIKMPGMDGFELLNQVRREQYLTHTPFIFLTALNEREDKVRAHNSGCDGYLSKPIDFSVLDATLRAHVARQKARDFVHRSAMKSTQRHVMTTLDDALAGPMSEASTLIRYLRETLPSLTPSQIERELANLQSKVNDHALRLNMFHHALTMQHKSNNEANTATLLVDDLIADAAEEYRAQTLHPHVTYKAQPPSATLVHGDRALLQHALAGLLGTVHHDFETSDVIHSRVADGWWYLSVCDHPSMAQDVDFEPIDALTDLSMLSPVTRERLVPLTYAQQVAEAHHGRLELKIWPEHFLAVRFVLPQAVQDSIAA